MADDIRKCAPDDPNRCQGSTAFGQCSNLSLPGKDRCKMHAGAMAIKNRKDVQGFMLTKWKDRVSSLTDNDAVKSLRCEVGMLKMMLETIWNRCNDESELVEQSGKIMTLAEKIEKVVLSCSRLEQKSGMMLDKTAALQIAGNICEIIGRHIDDPDLIENIAEEIIGTVLSIETKNLED